MRREELINKGYTEEQATELLNLFHSEQNDIKDNNAKLQKDLQEALNKVNELNKVTKTYEAEKKSQLSEMEQLEAMKKEIEEHLVNSKIVESRANAKNIFSEIGGVDDTILESIVSQDIEKTEANAKALVEFIKSREVATTKKTKEALLNNNVLPNSSSNTTNNDKANSMTKDEFNQLSIAEKTKIFKENKELWDKMTQQ